MSDPTIVCIRPRLQDALADRVGDQIIQLLHGNGAAAASRDAAIDLARARVVPIAPTLASPHAHLRAASLTLRYAGQKNLAVDDPGRRQLGMASVELSLDGVKDIVFHQSRNWDRDPILPCPGLARAAVIAVVRRWRNQLSQRDQSQMASRVAGAIHRISIRWRPK